MFRLLVLLLGLATNICHAERDIAAVDKTVELDLVFPTPNETYRRTYPFPIVLALQGMKAGWPHRVEMDWRVRGEGDDNLSWLQPSGIFPLDLPREALGDTDSSAWTEGESPGGLDTVFFTVGVINVFNSSATTFFIDYSLSLHFNCSIDEAADEVKVRLGDLYEPRGTVSFQVDEGGLDPAVNLAGDECAAGLATIRIKSSLKSDIPISEDPPCPILDEDDLSPEPSPCQLKLPGDLQSSVESLMLETASCTAGSWPAETLVEPCNDDMHAAGEDDDSAARLGFRVPAVMMGAVVVGLAGVCI